MEIVRPYLLEHEALEIAKEKVGESRSVGLELLPCYMIDITCKLLAGGEFYGEQHEKLWVNCLNRVVSKMEQMPNTVKEFVWEHLKLSSKLDRESATHLAKKWLKDDLTGFKEVMVKQTSSSTVFEKKLITVEEESLDARDVELYYFPFYHVEGDQGSIYIDAVTGDAYHSLIAI